MKIKKISTLGIGIALYVVLSFLIKVPLISHIQSDLGYIAFGAYLVLFGMPATIIGFAGCVIESLIFSGWIPYGWALGQLFIGLMCGWVFTKIKLKKYNTVFQIIVATIAVFIGVGLIKTVVECAMFSIPFVVKIVKNLVAFIADAVPMVFGVIIGNYFKKKGKKERD